MKTRIIWPAFLALIFMIAGGACGKGRGQSDGGANRVDPGRSTVRATTPVPADGNSASGVTVTLFDADGSVVSGVRVTIESDRAGDGVSDPASASDASGVSTGSVVSTEVGDAVITATAAGVVITQTATVHFEPTGPACGGQPVDLDTDPLHCGACDNACPAAANETATCVLGVCGTACLSGFDDCDLVVPGCEADLASAATCGSCAVACSDASNATGACIDPASGACGVTCDPGFGNCDGDPQNGCEEALDTAAFCGTCGTVCNGPGVQYGVAICADPATETCGVSCDVGYDNCDGDCRNGCEPLTTAAACGSCAVVCADAPNATGVCVDATSGSCGSLCDPGFDDCDGVIAGCETDVITDNANCGGCNMVCSGGAQVAAACAAGACGRTCNTGFADCNLDIDDPAGDGCETDLSLGDCGCALSPTGATSLCLTADSGARTVVFVTLQNASGSPVSGASVTIDSADLTWLGAVGESPSRPGTYFREAEVGAATGDALVQITAAEPSACGGTNTLQAVNITVAAPAVDSGATESGGCGPREGNLRVKVIAEASGAALPGAFVMVGETVSPSAFFASYEDVLAGAAGTLGNTALTDAGGFATFHDLGVALAAAPIVTAGTSGRAYVSMAGIDAADLVLALPDLPPPAPRVAFDGVVTGASYPTDNDGIVQTSMVMPTIDLDFVAEFDLARLLSDTRPVTASGGLFCNNQVFNIPGNLHVPDQTELFSCQITGGTPWALDLDQGAPIDLVALRADADMLALLSLTGGAGSAVDLLALMTPMAAGMIPAQSRTGPQTGLSIPLTETVAETMPVDLVGAPLGTLYALALADLDGQNGTGRLFLEGFKVQKSATDLSTLVATSDGLSTFSGKTDLAVGLSNAGGATSIVLDRSTLDATTPRVFSDFFQMPAAWVAVRTFGWADVAGVTADYHFSRSVMRRVTPLGSFSERYEPFWIVYADPAHRLGTGDRGFVLPTLPSSAPRAGNGGYLLPGFNQSNEWLFSAWYLGLHPSPTTVDLRAFRFAGETRELTRIVSEQVALP